MNVLPTIQPNSGAVAFLVLIICAGSLIILIILGKYLNFWQTKHVTGFRLSQRKFQELSDAAEFSSEEKEFLIAYLNQAKIPRVLEIFYTSNFSQSVMRQIFRATYTHPEMFSCGIEKAHSYIFSMTQKLENYLHKSTFTNSTQKIPQGVRFYLSFEAKELQDMQREGRLIGKMVANHRHNFEINLLNGNPRRIPKSTQVELELHKEGDYATYSSRVKGYDNSHRRKKLLVMEHGKRVQVVLGARRFKRKQLQIPAAIVPLEKVGDNKFRPAGEMINTLLCDSSMTGCGILSTLELPIHSYISVSYLNTYDNETIRFVCEIMGHGRLRNTEIDAVILQNRIVQIDDRDRNAISACVYEFEDEIDKTKKFLEQQKAATFDDKTIAILKNRA